MSQNSALGFSDDVDTVDIAEAEEADRAAATLQREEEMFMGLPLGAMSAACSQI